METVTTIAEVRKQIGRARSAGKVIGLVPTLGGMHEGHFSLVRAAREGCDFVVVSIFLNPTQFAPGEDLEKYPQTLADDQAACRDLGVNLVFAPATREMYPRPSLTTVQVRELTGTLCGASREGHFQGVCTVVAKLLNIVQPDRAYFGAKDFQQQVVVRRMVEDLNMPVEIVTCPTVREPDGLAMSTRNQYLSPEEREQATSLSSALSLGRQRIEADRPPAGEVIEAMREHLQAGAPDGEVEYLRIVDPATLRDVESTDREVLIALAVRIGQARLIDNTLVAGV